MHSFIKSLLPFIHSSRRKAWEKALSGDVAFESFQWVSLAKLFSKKFQAPSWTELSQEDIEKAILPECRDSVLVFQNGFFSKNLSRLGGLPASFLALPLFSAELSFGGFLQGRFDGLLQGEKDPFLLLNCATNQEGLFCYLPPKTKLSIPIQILHIYTEKTSLCMPRSVFFLGKESFCDLYISEYFLHDQEGWTNSSLDIFLEEYAQLNSYMLFDQARGMIHTDAVRATLKKGSIFKALTLGKGKQVFRQDFLVSLHKNAQSFLSGAFLLDQKAESHVHTKVDHREEGAYSLQKYKAVLQDQSKKSFTGKIFVNKGAQKTQAYQINKNLLLSDFAHSYSKPNLEIYADDVKASHGATMGKLNQEELFYLKARGLPESLAKNLLIEGFYKEIVQSIPLYSAQKYVSFSL